MYDINFSRDRSFLSRHYTTVAGSVNVHKSFLKIFKDRLRRDTSTPSILNRANIPTHFYYGGLKNGDSVEDAVRYYPRSFTQNIKEEDIGKMIISISSPSMKMYTFIMMALSLDIANLFEGYGYDYVPNPLHPVWISGRVLNIFKLLEKGGSKFDRIGISGWILDKLSKDDKEELIHEKLYNSLHGDLLQCNPEELDPNVSYGKQVIMDNSLFTFLSSRDKLHNGKAVHTVTRDDFKFMKLLMSNFNTDDFNCRAANYGFNPRANVNTFVVDIALPYMEDGKCKVKHISYGYLEDTTQMRGLGFEPTFVAHEWDNITE